MNKEIFLFYNVENFFPPNDSQNPVLYNWDDYKYELKVRKISQAFRFIKDDLGQLPAIIGLAEIGGLRVLEDLTKEHSPLQSYEIIYQKSDDSRGLSVALLLNPEKCILRSFSFLKFPLDDNPEFDSRDVLQAEVMVSNEKFQVFVLHLPSKRNLDIKKNLRIHILKKLRSIFVELHKKGEKIIIMGDFNENPDQNIIKEICKDDENNTVVKNPFEILFDHNVFSTFHGKKGVLFDQILISEIEKSSHKALIFNSAKLCNKDRKNSQFPLRTYSGSRYIGGYSDHFPVALLLEYSQQ